MLQTVSDTYIPLLILAGVSITLLIVSFFIKNPLLSIATLAAEAGLLFQDVILENEWYIVAIAVLMALSGIQLFVRMLKLGGDSW